MTTKKEKSIKRRKPDVIRDSEKIRNSIKVQMEIAGYSQKDIVEIAKEQERDIDQGALSRYINNDTSQKTMLSQADVIWLCKLVCVHVKLDIHISPCQPVKKDSPKTISEEKDSEN